VTDYYPLQVPNNYKCIIIQVGGNDVQNKRFHQAKDNMRKEEDAHKKGNPIQIQSIEEFELDTAATIIPKMKRSAERIRKTFPDSHIVQLSIQPR
jgi:lysophospholipase L1-like esterase